MVTSSARPRSLGTLVATVVLTAMASGWGCGQEMSSGMQPIDQDTIPMMPRPVAGTATIAGQVTDANGAGVAGATLTVAETDATVVTAADGRFELAVPSDSTLTLIAAAAGYAKTYRESVVVASQTRIDGFDFLMLSPDQLTSFNTLNGAKMSTGGLMAIRLHSMNGGCATDGARLEVWPPRGGQVAYSRPSATGGVDEPDPTLEGVQLGARIDAWITGAISPGNQLTVTVRQDGCRQMGQSPSLGGMVFPGLRHAAAGALTQADLFLDLPQ